LGCYRDAGTRDLSGPYFSDGQMSLEHCASLCVNYPYMGVQDGSWCFCGDSYGRYGPVFGCNMLCANNASEICGGGWANNIYISPNYAPTTTPAPPTTTTPVPTTTQPPSTPSPYGPTQPPTAPPPPTQPPTTTVYLTPAPTTTPAPTYPVYVGCYGDSYNPRDLSGSSFYDPNLMTVEYCASLCAGYTYAALQCSDRCFCGNSYGRYGGTTDCNWPCANNQQEMCGGSYRNSIYQLGPAS